MRRLGKEGRRKSGATASYTPILVNLGKIN